MLSQQQYRRQELPDRVDVRRAAAERTKRGPRRREVGGVVAALEHPDARPQVSKVARRPPVPRQPETLGKGSRDVAVSEEAVEDMVAALARRHRDDAGALE